MATFVIRLWLPDRPGALGAVASRIGSVGGDVVGIDILERGAGRAIDELAVEIPDVDLVELMVEEIRQVDGVDVEEVRPVADALHDPRLDALETAALLVGARTPDDAIVALCEHAVRTVGADWGVVVRLSRFDDVGATDDEDDELYGVEDSPAIAAACGSVPSLGWLVAFVEGSRSSARANSASGGNGAKGPDDVTWAPLVSAGMALVLGRDRLAFRARERHQAAALARIVDTRFRELSVLQSRTLHPSRYPLG